MFKKEGNLVTINLFSENDELYYQYKCLCFGNGKKLTKKVNKEINRVMKYMPVIRGEILEIEEIDII
jgi:hypothetical protein